MKSMIIGSILLVIVVSVVLCLLSARTTLAHCDTTAGPVIPEAKAALEKGDVTPVLKWVKKENEMEIKDAFAKAVAVRDKGQQAKELADQYFIETLVRLHRAGEGALCIATLDRACLKGSMKSSWRQKLGYLPNFGEELMKPGITRCVKRLDM